MKKFIGRIFAVNLIILALSYVLFSAQAAVPHLINYQGRLTDASGAPLNGAYDLTSHIYSVEAGGSPLWVEKQSGVVIQKGLFNVQLGSGIGTPLNLPFDQQYYLSIQVNTDPEMNPRQKLTSVGYAIRAEKADSLSVPVDLSNGVTGILPVNNGGSGRSVNLTTAQAVGTSSISMSSDTLADMPDMSVTLTTAGTKLLCMYQGAIKMAGNGAFCYAEVNILVDGINKTRQRGGTDSGTTSFGGGMPFSLQWLATGLTPGSHTVKIQWRGKGNDAPNVTQDGTVSPRVLTVIDLP